MIYIHSFILSIAVFDPGISEGSQHGSHSFPRARCLGTTCSRTSKSSLGRLASPRIHVLKGNFIRGCWWIECNLDTFRLNISKSSHSVYPLVVKHSCWKWSLYQIFPLKMVIFHSYVKLPEGILIWVNLVSAADDLTSPMYGGKLRSTAGVSWHPCEPPPW